MSDDDTPTGEAGRSAAGFDLGPLSDEEKERLAADLDPEARRILLDHGTERPGCGVFLDNKKDGTYVCRLCGLPLFRSNAKFDSGTGWPSFNDPYDPDHIAYLRDWSMLIPRTEIRCKRCDSHLGHVFSDGPPPTGQRYCMNSVAMDFVDEGQPFPVRTSLDEAS